MPQESDGSVILEMLGTQVFNDDKIPLIGLSSARAAEPGIKPGKTQSIVLVTTKTEFDQLPESKQQGILRDRCILVLAIGAEPDPGFNLDTMARYWNPYVECDVHGASAHVTSCAILIHS